MRGDTSSVFLGSNTLVITNRHEAGAQLGDIRFHRSDTTEATDSIQRWQPEHQITLGQLDMQSWDYATVDPSAPRHKMPLPTSQTC